MTILGYDTFEISITIIFGITILGLCLIGGIICFLVKVTKSGIESKRLNREQLIIQRDENFRSKGITPETFFQMRKEQIAQRLDDISGVYIIYNVTKNMYYVGQATRLYFRLNQHFTGHGNGDVYADYKYGDSFLIHHIPLNGSGYSSLDALERAKIAEYNAYNNGYNKTQGNQ